MNTNIDSPIADFPTTNSLPDLKDSEVRRRPFDWYDVLANFNAHRGQIVMATLVALAAALISVPVPLLMPLVSGRSAVESSRRNWLRWLMRSFRVQWQTPLGYILAVSVFTIGLQYWQFSAASLAHPSILIDFKRFNFSHAPATNRASRSSFDERIRISWVAATVASYMVVDLNTIDDFHRRDGEPLCGFVVNVTGCCRAFCCGCIGSSGCLYW